MKVSYNVPPTKEQLVYIAVKVKATSLPDGFIENKI